MRLIISPVIILIALKLSCALPVIKNHNDDKANNENNEIDIEDHGFNEINPKYDPNNPHMRTKWDEERRVKLEILKHLYNRERELENGDDLNPFKHHEDGDPVKIHAAEIADVKKSILKITEELSKIDHNRRELFKEYEMQKRFNEQQREMGNELDEVKRKQYHEEQEKLKEKHKKHEPLHHPGSKQQLEEVWEKQDHINQAFDPETFFNLHDMDGNGVWDQDEVKSLFKKELDKMYEEGMPEDDLIERREEMERMREHVFDQADIDKNGFIDFHEFLKQTQEPEFQKDDGWKGLDEQQIYTQEDYDNYMKYHQQQLAAHAAAQANAHAAANGIPQQHPNAVNYQQLPPPQHHGDPNLQYHQGQVPHPAQYQNQMPQYQQYPVHQQIPPQQQQVPVYQQPHSPQYQQVPIQQQQYQAPQQQQQQQHNQVLQQNVPHDQQYQYQAVQQPHQPQKQNQPNVQQQQQQQQQQNGNVPLNAQSSQVASNIQNQASAQQQQQQQKPVSHSVEKQNSPAAPAVGTNINANHV